MELHVLIYGLLAIIPNNTSLDIYVPASTTASASDGCPIHAHDAFFAFALRGNEDNCIESEICKKTTMLRVAVPQTEIPACVCSLNDAQVTVLLEPSPRASVTSLTIPITPNSLGPQTAKSAGWIAKMSEIAADSAAADADSLILGARVAAELSLPAKRLDSCFLGHARGNDNTIYTYKVAYRDLTGDNSVASRDAVTTAIRATATVADGTTSVFVKKKDVKQKVGTLCDPSGCRLAFIANEQVSEEHAFAETRCNDVAGARHFERYYELAHDQPQRGKAPVPFIVGQPRTDIEENQCDVDAPILRKAEATTKRLTQPPLCPPVLLEVPNVN